MTDKPILEVKDLSVNFYTNRRCNRALRGVSFSLDPGRILCVVGESGCGKSVTASAVLGLLPELARIEGGSITYNSDKGPIEIEKLPRMGRKMRAIRGKDIAMIFQDPMTALNPMLSVGYQINESLLEHGMAGNKRAAARQSIELLGSMGIPLPEQRVREYPHQYSGGMRQRAMIAMAMSCKPKILIADEPTTALDVTIQAQIFDLMLELREKENTAILLITHDMGVVCELADEVAVMYMGNIVENGSAAHVLAKPAHPYTKALLESIPVFGQGKNQNLEPIRGNTPDPFDRPPGCQFAPRCDYYTPDCDNGMPPQVRLSDSHFCLCRNPVLAEPALAEGGIADA